ncbi:MAG: transglutaminase family protein [Saprospiraceae bacterium]
MPTYKIKHITHYKYEQAVYDSINQIMLYPFQDYLQKVIFHEIRITNKPAIEVFTDKFGNSLGIFSILSPHDELNVTSQLEVEVLPLVEPEFSISIDDQWKQYEGLAKHFMYKDYLTIESIKNMASIEEKVNELLDTSQSPLQNAQAFSKYINQNFEYNQIVTSVETEVDEIWNIKAGVCQDFAHVLLVLLRSIKIPSRYVSGYICPRHDEFRGAGATHAWVEIYIPDYGWIGLDPTNDCLASDKHVRLAVGRYFNDCTPVKGIFKGNLNHVLEVSVTVEDADSSVKKSFDPNAFQNQPPVPPAFVSQVVAPTHNDNSYQMHKQMQIQMQQ